MTEKEKINKILRAAYADNSFVNLCDMVIDDISCGHAQLSMKITPEKHTNMYGVVHGGALAALADTVAGVTCSSVGARVVTINYTINFIKNIHAGDTAVSKGSIIQLGHKVIIVKIETYRGNGELLTEMLATMFRIGKFEEVPEEW